MENEEMINTSVTLPEPLLGEIKKIAKREGRSVSSQVRLFLAEAVKLPDPVPAEHPAHPKAA